MQPLKIAKSYPPIAYFSNPLQIYYAAEIRSSRSVIEMDRIAESRREKKNILARALERCRSLGRLHRRRIPVPSASEIGKPWRRSKSSAGGRQLGRGCFAVVVGPLKERFVVKMECINHPLFRKLLEEAESEFGFKSPGPIELPCEVDLFFKVMGAMDEEIGAAAAAEAESPRCGGSFVRCYSAGAGGRYRILSPSRLIVDHGSLSSTRGYSYK